MTNSHIIKCIHRHKISIDKIAFTFSTNTCPFKFISGLYVLISAYENHREKKTEKRAYTITNFEDDCFEIIVKIKDDGFSNWLDSNLFVDGKLEIYEVGGNITIERISNMKNILLLANGSGITLPIAILRQAVKYGYESNYKLYLSTTSIASIPNLIELLSWNFSKNISISTDFFITKEEGFNIEQGVFHQGRFTHDVLHNIDPDTDCVILCGNNTFVHEYMNIMQTSHPSILCLAEAFTSPTKNTVEPKDTEVVALTVENFDCTLPDCPKSLSILQTLEENDIPIKNKCRSGICGTCKIFIVDGEVYKEADLCLSEQEHDLGYALACCSFPKTDEVIISLCNS